MFDHGDGVLLALPYCTRQLYQRYCTSILSMGPKCSSLVKSLHKTLFQNSTDLSTGCLAYSSSSWSRVAFNKMAQHEGHLVFFLYSALKCCCFFPSFNQVTVQVFGGKLWKMFSVSLIEQCIPFIILCSQSFSGIQNLILWIRLPAASLSTFSVLEIIL